MLINSIKENGYRLNSDVSIESDDTESLSKHKIMSSEITVNIGRNGEYLFQDGRHRLAIAQILGLNLVPVKVLVRHEKWQELRELLLSMTKGTGGASKAGLLYQPPLHPDLHDFPAAHSCEDRFVAIKPYVSKRSGKLLDVGANLGYFCHKFEELGYDCYAIELLRDIALAADRIRAAENKTFKVINSDLFDMFENSTFKNTKFDIVLALNILHHFIKTEAKYNRLTKWLGQLTVDTVFFEPHRFDDPQMQKAYKNFKEEEFVDFILRHANLKMAELIHQANDGRKLYKLSK